MRIQLDRKKLSSKTDPSGKPWSYASNESCWKSFQDACSFFSTDAVDATETVILKIQQGHIRNRQPEPNLDISPARKAFRYTLADIATVHNELDSDVTGLLTLHYAEGVLQQAAFSLNNKNY